MLPIDDFYADVDASGGVPLSFYDPTHTRRTNKLSGRGTVRPNPARTTVTQPKYLWDVAFDDTTKSLTGQGERS
jgi:hypothetical protein